MARSRARFFRIDSAFHASAPGRRHIGPFRACSSFTRVTACQVVRPPFCGLCRAVPTRPVPQPSRSPAIESNHQPFEWVLPPLVICPFRAHAEASLKPAPHGPAAHVCGHVERENVKLFLRGPLLPRLESGSLLRLAGMRFHRVMHRGLRHQVRINSPQLLCGQSRHSQPRHQREALRTYLRGLFLHVLFVLINLVEDCCSVHLPIPVSASGVMLPLTTTV